MRSLALLLLASSVAAAQTVPSTDPHLSAAVAMLKSDNAWTLRQQVQLSAIPSSPFKEAKRGEEFARRLRALGLTDVHVDSVGNVIAKRPGSGDGPTVVIAGHLDTVFPLGTNFTVRRDGTRLLGPGIGDDSRGLAVVLSVARAFQRSRVRTAGPVYFVGDVGEEGQGNLRGMRYLFGREMKGRIDYFISVDGEGLGLVSRAVGSHRYRVTYKGPGGHSYGAFGIPNPIHALGRAIAQIADLKVPTSPKTTFNVGVIQGGTSVNSISATGTMDIDMRSESAESLDQLDAKVQKILVDGLAAENGRWSGPRAASAKLALVIDTIGIRPTGGQADSAYIVRTALAAGRTLGFTSRTGAASTDANIPISLGIPAITIDGGGTGGGAHSLGEWYDDGPSGWLGPQWAALIVATLAGVR